MDLKKSPKANLEDKKIVFLLMGLVVALGVIFVALEWSQQEVTKHDVVDVEMDFEEELDIVQTTQDATPPPPPPPAPEVVVELNIVENEVETQSIEFTSEIDEQTAIVVQAPVAAAAPIEEEDEQVVFQIVETMPEFPGGQAELFKYLSENIKYPVIAQENGIQGRVICQFTVNRDGSIVDIEVVRSAGDASLDREAVRVIQSMPKWNPGKQRGKAVRVKFTVPVNFRLQ